MTSIAYKDGIVAADSREIWAGSISRCAKLFRKRVARRDVVFATAGDSYTGMIFVDWYGSGPTLPAAFSHLDKDDDFEVMILDRGKVFVANRHCRPLQIDLPFFALGSGTDACMAAMHCGKSAREAIRVACLIDPNSAPPIVTMSAPWKRRE